MDGRDGTLMKDRGQCGGGGGGAKGLKTQLSSAFGGARRGVVTFGDLTCGINDFSGLPRDGIN